MQMWWKDRGFPSPEIELLPPTGLVIVFGGKPICGGFLFKTDAKIAMINHLVSDPRVEGSLRSEATDYLLFALLSHARDEGFRVVTGATNLPRLMRRYELLGFVQTDEQISHFRRDFKCH